MSKEKFPYEGIIHGNYKKKNILKLNLFLMVIFVPITLLIIFGLLDFFRGPRAAEPRNLSANELASMLFYLLLYAVIIPYFTIFIIFYIYYSSYIRNFTFIITEDNIIIDQGVFTKAKVTIPYSRIQSINVFAGFFDRRFKIYTVKISTASSDSSISGGAFFKPRKEGQIPGIKDPRIIEEKINEMIKKHSQLPEGLKDKIFKPEELAFDNFISYILSKMREGERLKTNIKELREKKNISRSLLAEKVGVPIQTIDYLEEGRYNPSLSLAYKIATLLECKIEDLFQLA
ncbi:MAG: PH domain-containing protein [Promethearchaeota archaeon]